MPHPWNIAVLLLGILCLLPLEAAAQKVALCAEKNVGISNRIEDELRASGMSVLRSAAAEAAECTDCAALVTVDVAQKKTEVRARKADGEVVLKSVPLPGDDDVEAEQVASLRVVEAVRVAIAEANTRKPAVSTPQTTAETSNPEAGRPKGLFAVGIGPSIIWSPGGFEPQFALSPNVSFHAHPKIELHLRIDFPLNELEVEDDDASAAMKVYIASLSIAFNPMNRDGAVALPVGLAIGVAWSPYDGAADYPFEGRSGTLCSATVEGRLGVHIRLARHFRLRLDGGAGVFLPEQVILFADEDAASFGRPFVRGLLGLEVTFP